MATIPPGTEPLVPGDTFHYGDVHVTVPEGFHSGMRMYVGLEGTPPAGLALLETTCLLDAARTYTKTKATPEQPELGVLCCREAWKTAAPPGNCSSARNY